MAHTGKTGADAIFKFTNSICKTFRRYRTKFLVIIEATRVAGAITPDEATIIDTFVLSVDAACSALEKLADYSGF